MPTVQHMEWFRNPNNDRFEMRVPVGCKRDLVKFMFYINRRGKVYSSQAEFILTLIDKELAANNDAVEEHWQKFFMPKK